MDDEKEKPSVADGVWIILVCIAILAIAPVVLSTFKIGGIPGASSIVSYFTNHYHGFVEGLRRIFGWIVGISIPISVALSFMIVYCVERLKSIRAIEHDKFDKPVEQALVKNEANGDPAMAHRWSTVVEHIESVNPNDWKQAILEADIMLDDLLTNMGYRGESIGEKLKRVEPAHFQTLNDAWEGHKVRNQIAHEGSAFQLTQMEARAVIQQYRKVFEEFYFI
jgi:hypothetical protein